MLAQDGMGKFFKRRTEPGWRESKTEPSRMEEKGIPGFWGSKRGRKAGHRQFGQTHRVGHWVSEEGEGRRAAEARPLCGRP